ncbi:TIGR01244 family sulfur transferase [Tropicimonas sp. IMCC34011]|uniref:TIGR01244 family sulfur transferase n=1 Tax=Tropicimonas sp. IMCC34011 TaxID=2248759 RepID=UPI000E24CC34|nr:TIGR01244 family sulfur transferase [Tropicimonas sp. IMCC34011]
MDIRQLTPAHSVSPQIEPDDVPALAAAGFVSIICNRPDSEVPPGLQSADLRKAAEAAGLQFFDNPITHQTMTPEKVEAQVAAIAGAGPSLAYCASGTRCTVVWMLGAAPSTPPDELIETAARAGYNLEQLRPQLEALHRG